MTGDVIKINLNINSSSSWVRFQPAIKYCVNIVFKGWTSLFNNVSVAATDRIQDVWIYRIFIASYEQQAL